MPRAAAAFLCAFALGAARPAAAQHPLDAVVAELLPRVEALSGLQALEPLHIATMDRDTLRAKLLAESLGQSEEIASVGRAYRLLGLVPDTFDLVGEIPSLQADALAGYYDPRVDTLYILDDLDVLTALPTIAHEMTHALQDQHYDLEALLTGTVDNDRSMALRAGVEGHASLVMLLMQLELLLGEPVPFDSLPDLGRLPLEAMMPGRPSPEFAAAPRVLRESGAFPYGRGLGFVHALRTRDPAAVPFGALQAESTEQVVHPFDHFLDRRDPPVNLAFDPPGDGWSTVYENSLGQFELSILLMERHGLQSEALAEGWAGDRYRILGDGTGYVLDWTIVWDDARAASRFVTAYTQILRTRKGVSGDVVALDLEGRPAVRVIEAEPGVDIRRLPPPGARLR